LYNDSENLEFVSNQLKLTFVALISLSCSPIQNKTEAWAPCSVTGSFSEKYSCARIGTRSRIYNNKICKLERCIPHITNYRFIGEVYLHILKLAGAVAFKFLCKQAFKGIEYILNKKRR
jgi:hypothetical protein